MSINFSQASAAHIDAAWFERDANRQASVQIALFAQWLSAQTTENEKLAAFLRDSFPGPLATATSDWLDERAADAQAAPQTPFDMPSYVLDNAVRVEEKKAGTSRAVVGPGSDERQRHLQRHGLNDLVCHRVVLRRGV